MVGEKKKKEPAAQIPVEEDLDLFGDHKPKRRVPRFVYRIAVILLVCVVGLTLWVNRENISLEGFWNWAQTQIMGTGDGGGFPAPVTGRNVEKKNLLASGNQPAVVSDTELIVWNSTAKELTASQHSCRYPVLCEAGGRYLVYDLGGTSYRIVTTQKTLKKGQADEKIYAAAVSESGRWAVATGSQDYASELTVYLEDGSKQYRYRFVDARVTAVALSEDGSRGAVTAVTASQGAILSRLYLFDFSESDPVSVFESRDNCLYGVSFGAGRVCAVGDRSALTLAFGAQKPSEYVYNGTLQDASLHGDRMVLAVASYSGGSEIVEFDGGDSPVTRFSLGETVLSVDSSGTTLAVLTEGTIRTYLSGTGDKTAERPAGSDARAIAMGNAGTAYVLGNGEVRRVDL